MEYLSRNKEKFIKHKQYVPKIFVTIQKWNDVIKNTPGIFIVLLSPPINYLNYFFVSKYIIQQLW